MDEIFVDTNVLIDYSKGRTGFLEKLLLDQAKGRVKLYINAVVISEYFTDENMKKARVLRQATDFIGLFSILSVTREEGILSGKFMRDKEVSLMGDALIAAACLVSNLKLATRNKKHFKKVPKLKFYKID